MRDPKLSSDSKITNLKHAFTQLRLRTALCSLFIVAAVAAAAGAIASSRLSPQQGVAVSSPPAAAQKISPWVMEHTANGQQAEFFVVLADQADLSQAHSWNTKVEKGRFVYNSLVKKAQIAQAPILKWVRERGIHYQSFYIVNAILVKGGRDVAEALAARPDVARLEGNPRIRAHLPQPGPSVDAPPSFQNPATVEPGINYTHAPDVWALGYTGQNIVVASADTGVRWTHDALKPHYRGWDGQNADHNYNWHDAIHDSVGNPCGNNSPFPCDDNSHGSHTTGTMIGDDGMGNQIGMAPGAKWIACRMIDGPADLTTPARCIECMEWFLAPYPIGGGQGDPTKAPDITNNSWVCAAADGCSPDTLQAAVEAQAAAGIMMVVAGGNDGGQGCSSVFYPPAIYEAAYAVGALVTATDNIASFSSRGPVTIDGSGRIKPDLTAPGTNVRSSVNTSDSAYEWIGWSGTSMATPHISGAMALLWSAMPTLKNQITASRTAINNAAHFISSNQCGDAGPPNNVYGWGRIDILAAVAATPTPTPCQAWVDRAPLPYNAGGVFAVSDGTSVYAGGGADLAKGIFHNDLLRYDPPPNDTWTPLQSSPDYHYHSQAVYFDGKIYNIGGYNENLEVTDTNRIYDIASNIWLPTGAPMPQPLSQMATAVWDGVIYVAGGNNSAGRVDTLYAYHIDSNTWTTLTSMPETVTLPGFGVIDGKLYIAGGSSNAGYLNTLYIYDIATNQWITPGANLLQAIARPGSTVFDDGTGLKLYLYGGRLPDLTPTNITQIYDPSHNTWSYGPVMNVPLFSSYGAAVGADSIVAPGGLDANFVGLIDNEQLINIACTSPTPTSTPTVTPTSTATATATPSSTPTPSATATPAATARPSPTPRPRPTPAPRPSP
jgi:serine protease AprX